MKGIASGVIALACSLAFGATALAQIPDYVAKAVADPGRAQDAKNDERRKGAEIVAFSAAKPGDKVLELIPGGVYLIVDHSAELGSGLRDTETLHRIDETTVKQQVIAAGFEYVGESDVLRNRADDRKSNVFNPAIRGRTDQFVYEFRKPLK
jgi:predicted methyltransferase